MNFVMQLNLTPEKILRAIRASKLAKVYIEKVAIAVMKKKGSARAGNERTETQTPKRNPHFAVYPKSPESLPASATRAGAAGRASAGIGICETNSIMHYLIDKLPKVLIAVRSASASLFSGLCDYCLLRDQRFSLYTY